MLSLRRSHCQLKRALSKHVYCWSSWLSNHNTTTVRSFASKEERKKEQQKIKELTSGEKQNVNLGKDGTTKDTDKKPDVRHPLDQQEGEKELRNPGKSPLDHHDPGTIDPVKGDRKPYSTYTRVNHMYRTSSRSLHTSLHRYYTTSVSRSMVALNPSENIPQSADGFVGYTEDGRRLTTKRPSAKNPLNKSGYAQSVSRERFRQEEEEQDQNVYGDELEQVYEKSRTRPPTQTRSH